MIELSESLGDDLKIKNNEMNQQEKHLINELDEEFSKQESKCYRLKKSKIFLSVFILSVSSLSVFLLHLLLSIIKNSDIYDYPEGIMQIDTSENKDFSYNNLSKYNNISLLYCLNNLYKYIGMVSIASALYNADNTTILNFHIFLSKKEDKKIPKLIKSMKYMINNRSRFYFYHINDKKIKRTFGFSETGMFYRLLAAELIKDLDKIIYIDGDTLVLKDLTEMYNLNLGDNYMLGTLEVIAGTYYAGKNISNDYVNSGILFMNLTKMRNNKIYDKFKEYISNPVTRKNIVMHDQCLINEVCKGKIGILKPKYGSINIYNDEKKHQLSRQRSPLAYTPQEREEGFKNAFIVHFKIWAEDTVPNYKDQWWNKYAKMTPVYKIIEKKVKKNVKKN